MGEQSLVQLAHPIMQLLPPDRSGAAAMVLRGVEAAVAGTGAAEVDPRVPVGAADLLLPPCLIQLERARSGYYPRRLSSTRLELQKGCRALLVVTG